MKWLMGVLVDFDGSTIVNMQRMEFVPPQTMQDRDGTQYEIVFYTDAKPGYDFGVALYVRQGRRGL